ERRCGCDARLAFGVVAQPRAFTDTISRVRSVGWAVCPGARDRWGFPRAGETGAFPVQSSLRRRHAVRHPPGPRSGPRTAWGRRSGDCTGATRPVTTLLREAGPRRAPLLAEARPAGSNAPVVSFPR